MGGLVVEVVVVNERGTEREVRLRAASRATLADVAAALAPDAIGDVVVSVDGERRDPATSVAAAGLRWGSVVAVGARGEDGHRHAAPALGGRGEDGRHRIGAPERDGHRHAAPAAPAAAAPAAPAAAAPAAAAVAVAAVAPVAAVEVVAGLAAGATVGLAPGPHLVGSAPGCDVRLADPAVSSHHCLLHVGPLGAVVVEDLAPAVPTHLGGTPVLGRHLVPAGTRLRVGHHLLAVRPAGEDEPTRGPAAPAAPAADVTMAFNRPPRPRPPDHEVPPLGLPDALATTGGAGRLGLASGLVLLLGGLAAWVVMRSPLSLVFVGVGALGTVASGLEARRHEHRGRRAEVQRRRRQLTELDMAVAEHMAVAAERRRRDQPNLAEVVARAHAGSGRLWERRRHHGDAFVLSIGWGALPGRVPADAGGTPAPDVREVLDAAAERDVPVPVRLGAGHSVGVVGPQPAALAVARALVVQAAVLHGPADLTIVVGADPAAWAWTRWLPHTRHPHGGAPLVAATADELDALLADLPAGTAERGDDSRPTVLLVLDAAVAATPPSAARRTVLAGGAGPVSLLVVAARARDLPARCGTVVEVDGDGRARLGGPEHGEPVADVLAAGCPLRLARRAARALARWHDPEQAGGAEGLPAAVGLLALLGEGSREADVLAGRWRTAGPDPPPRTPIGVAADGVVEVDLARDGPHALVAGTTGAGKSELLRSLVAGLAARCSPQEVTFVLVDYKGGAAFDACAHLPHTVGVVTDLDGHLAERALRSLEAELAHRERQLRAAGAADLVAYRRRAAGDEALPRLVVVIDEFATLVGELPGFVDALVGIAQRGRSLGVHLVLATQRPSGAVNDNIRANTNLRVALRVQDGGDSSDVIGAPVAVDLPRARPGRMWLRFGPAELVLAQSARVTGPPAPDGGPLVTVTRLDDDERPDRALDVAPSRPPDEAGFTAAGDEPTELSLLVAATRAAAARLGGPEPRRPWLDPLPPTIPLDELPVGAVARADHPDRQAQPPLGWEPAEGNLALYGIAGAGTTTALASLALALAAARPPDAQHLYVLDMGAGELAPLAGLPHVGAVVTAGEDERRWRLVRTLRRLLDERKAGAAGPDVTLLVDGYGALVVEHEDLFGQRLLDELARIIAEGPAVGLTTVVAAERPGAVPFRVLAGIPHRWLFRLAEPADHAAFGVPAARLPRFCPGRAVAAGSGVELQIGHPGPLPAAVATVARRWPAGANAVPITSLPRTVAASALPAPRCDGTPWTIPFGIGDHHLAPVALVLHEGEHALVAGPARSGRSTALLTLARAVRRARPEVHVVVLAGRRSPVVALAAGGAELVTEEGLGGACAGVATERPVLVVVDDAEAVADEHQVLARLLAPGRAGNIRVLAAGRVEALRTAYGHWTALVRRSRTGLLLAADPEFDGDLLGAVLPRRSPVPPAPGRGYLVNEGAAELVQVAQ